MTDSSARRHSGADSSAGGAAATGGVDFDALVLAWMAAYMLANIALPQPWRLTHGQLTSIGGQTGEPMDDCGAITSDDGRVFVQSKRTLALGTVESSPLASAIDQAARQFRERIPAEQPRTPHEHVDVLAILSDRKATGPVKRGLVEVVGALSTLPSQLPFDTVATNEARTKALAELLKHSRRSLALADGVDSVSDDDLRSFFRVLYVGILELDPGESERTSAETLLAQILTEPDRAASAFDELARYGQDLGRNRQWARAQDVRAFLRSRGFPLLDDPKYAADIERLRIATRSLLDSQQSALVIQAPDGPVEIERSIVEVLRESTGALALTGDAGSGKSAAANKLVRELCEQEQDVVYLTADSFSPDIVALRGLNFTTSLSETLANWDGDGVGTLVIDGIDSSRGTGDSGWVLALLPELEGSRWRTIATLRTYDLRNGPKWRRVFRGVTLDESAAVADLQEVRHLLVGDLGDVEMAQARAQSASLAGLIDGADDQLLALLRNPFNLNLAADLLLFGSPDVTAVRSRLDLLDEYWKARVRGGAQGLQQAATVRRLTERMVEARRTTVDVLSAVDSGQLDAIALLLGVGVLRELPAVQHSDAQLVEFSHPLLFDYAVATTVLSSTEPVDFPSRLDGEPNLVIRLWPSVELRLSSLWQQDADRSRFWELAIRFAVRPGGHPLAGIAAAFVVLRTHGTPEDFAPLFSALRGEQTAEALRCLNHISGSLNCPDIPVGDRRASVSSLSEASAVTAEIAFERDDLSVADATRVLLRRIDEIVPLDPGVDGAGARARAARVLMSFALANPAAAGRLDVARMVSSLLAVSVLIDGEQCAPVLEAMLAPEVMEHWGVLAIRSALDYVPRIAVPYPELAQRIFDAIWSFQETRDGALGFGTEISRMVMNWRSVLDTTRTHSAEVFPRLLNVSPLIASAVLVSALTNNETDSHHGLIVQPSLTPQDDPLTKMAKHIGIWLKSVADDSQTFEPVLDVLVADSTANPALWQSVVSAGTDHPATLGRSILARLPAALFNPASLALGPFVRAMSNELQGEEHAALEQLILSVTAPEPSNAEWQTLLVTRLAVNLTQDHVQLEEIRTLLPEEEGPNPSVAEALPILGWGSPDDGAIPWMDDHAAFPPEVQSLLDDARSANEQAASEPAKAAARVRLRDAFLSVFEVHASNPEILDVLAEPARVLAMFDAAVTPDSDLGSAVLQTFLGVLGAAS